MQVYILDVETTGFAEPIIPVEVARILVHGNNPIDCHLAQTFHQFYNPGKDIEWGAVSAHHILPEDVANAPSWDEPELAKSGDFLVGHNVDYDWAAIGSPIGVKRICTLALSRYLRPDMDAHRLGAMVYHINGQVAATRDRVQRAHSAVHDAGMAYEVLIWAAKELGATTWEQLYELSEVARIPLKFTFGKNRGVYIKDIDSHDPGYRRWMLKQKDIDPYLRKALEQSGLGR